jgi:hypothetical protein
MLLIIRTNHVGEREREHWDPDGDHVQKLGQLKASVEQRGDLMPDISHRLPNNESLKETLTNVLCVLPCNCYSTGASKRRL